MNNIDDFNLGCALILAKLYESFPVPVALDVAALDDGGDLLPEEREARLASRRRTFTATVQFLADEGYLVVGGAVGLPDCGVYGKTRLTAKGLAQLSRTPESIRPPAQTLGQRLADIARDGAGLAARDAIRALVGQLLS